MIRSLLKNAVGGAVKPDMRRQHPPVKKIGEETRKRAIDRIYVFVCSVRSTG